MATDNKKKIDPIERIGQMIDEKISAAFEGREQKEKEAKDPMARLEGMIDRAVGKHFEAFAKNLEEAEAADVAGKSKEKPADEDDGGILKVLGF
jgi:hypothetical protein